MNTANRDYWKNRDGALYADQQVVRRESGNESYGRQEEWLLGFLRDRYASLGRPVRVLDYGVGFGRMAHVLAGVEGVEYYGYDISGPMVAPLLADPPAALRDGLEARVRVGEDVAETMSGLTFDVIFTVSVLIHNSPEQASAVVQGMRGLLDAAGVICLIENRAVSISMLANQWHAGCWSHDVVGTLAPDMNVEVNDLIIPDHGLYILRESLGGARQIMIATSGGMEPTDMAWYLLATRERTIAVVRSLESEISTSASDLANSRDSVELYSQAEARAAAGLAEITDVLEGDPAAHVGRHHLIEALDVLPRLAGRVRALELERQSAQQFETRAADLQLETEAQSKELVALTWKLGMREQIARLMREPFVDFKKDVTARPHAPTSVHEQKAVYQFNSERDTRFSQQLQGHERVCHLMHQEWFGMRAACGALPGNKLAISAATSPTHIEVEEVARLLSERGINRLVIHGYSLRMELWIKGLAAVGFNRIFLIWHGAPVMWVHGDERRLLESALQLVKQGMIERIHGMRPGTYPVFGDAGWAPQIYNMPPRYARREKQREHRQSDAVAFAPSWNLIHKNLFTNVSAAIATPSIGEVWTLASHFELPFATSKRIKHLPQMDQMQMMETMELSDVVMNASIVDCHPMVELEALAAGTPAIRGRLGLDALEDHDYVRLTQVDDALSIADIQSVLTRVLAVPAPELEQMMDSYAKALTELSFARYSDMLGI